MNIAEKNGQPSMEEILASIRRIIADEPQGLHQVIDIRAPRPAVHLVHGDDDQPDFELPAIFRPQQVAEKPAPLFGRLTDAIRHASGNAVSNFKNGAEAHDPYQPVAAVNGSGPVLHEMPDPPLSALNMSRSSEPQPYQAQQAPAPLRPTYAAPPEPAPAMAPEPLQASSDRKNGSWYTPAPQPAASSEGVKRVMAPFRDTRMVRMSSDAPSPPAAQASPEPAPYAPAAPAETVAFFTPMPAPDVPVQLAPEASVEAALASGAMPSHAPPPVPALEAQMQSAQAAPQPIDSIENATADLLRPMLRQWLAENMPRMVEKALHIEVAESVKAQRKNGEY